MAASATTMRARRASLFASVFPPGLSQPTPLLAPLSPGEPFGGPRATPAAAAAASLASLASHGPSTPAADQVRWDRAWHVVTSRIQLPSSVAVEDSFGTLAPESQDLDHVFAEALALLLDPAALVPRAAHTEDILLWHTHQVRRHFVQHVLPLLAAAAAHAAHDQALVGAIQTLEAAHRQYLYGLTLLVRGIRHDAPRAAALARFRRHLHAIVGNSWAPGLASALRSVLARLVATVLHVGQAPLRELPPDSPASRVARSELLGLIDSLATVGLAGDRFEVLLAEVMDACMRRFVRTTYSGLWLAPAPAPTPALAPDLADADAAAPPPAGCIAHLRDWVENCYGRLAVDVFARLGRRVSWRRVERWRDVAVGRLATLRIHELFDIVLDWPASRGGLDDLRSAVTTPERRLQLTDTFSATLQRRLLHPGRSTLDILQTYLSMIRAFHALDASKVLLDRVAHALQLYLCQRDDAIRIVVTGLLSNPAAAAAAADAATDAGKPALVELAAVLNDSQQQQQQPDDDDLDWDDEAWVPDPVDAGVNYKRPKSQDVIGTLLNALGSQDIFIKEFQLIIAERLLSDQTAFHQETRVLGLLKKRFGDNALQNCDVMIKDIYDSRRLDAALARRLRADADAPTEPDAGPAYHSKILSRLFWPSLPHEAFRVPAPVAAVQARYGAGFEKLKTSRRLAWLDHLGSATVLLDLEDRSLDVVCKTYEAAVIYAFQPDDDDDDDDDDDGRGPGPQRRTLGELSDTLAMDEDLLKLALKFWLSKRVLRDVGGQTYAVVERLDDDDGGEAPRRDGDESSTKSSDDDDDDGPSPRKAGNADAEEQARRAVYWQFIVGMLTNSSPAMPLGQIAMMMKMLIADGCLWSNEELEEFLGERVAAGELELAGGKYRLPKK